MRALLCTSALARQCLLARHSVPTGGALTVDVRIYVLGTRSFG